MKVPRGKHLSNGSKALSAIFLITAFVLKGFKQIDVSIDDAIKVAGFLALVFAPVDVSLWIENLRRLRPGEPVGQEPGPSEDSCGKE